MKGSVLKRCGCRDDAGRELGSACPELAAKRKRHGTYGWAVRLETTTSARLRLVKRWGFARKEDAAAALDRVHDLVKLAGADAPARRRIGDLVVASTRNGGELPAVDDVRRRLGLGRALDHSETVGEWLEIWYAGKRKLRESSARTYRQHLDHYLIPQLGAAPLDRLSAEHIADLFDLIDEWNAELATARVEGRPAVLDGDVRRRVGIVGVATQRRVYATLRNALNAAVRQRRVVFNPCLGVEMPEETREPARTWSPEQVGTFLESTADDRLALLYRLVLLCGLRRGEACGLRWADIDLTAQELRVVRPILQLGGRLVTGRPKTRAGERVVSFDAGTAALLKTERRLRRAEKLAAGELYEDNDLVSCAEDGRPVRPDHVTRHFRELAAAAGLPVIKLHEGRHTAATLALEAGIDIKIVSDRMGHSTTRITQDLYQHVRRAVHGDAAEKVVALLPERTRAQGTGS